MSSLHLAFAVSFAALVLSITVDPMLNTSSTRLPSLFFVIAMFFPLCTCSQGLYDISYVKETYLWTV